MRACTSIRTAMRSPCISDGQALWKAGGGAILASVHRDESCDGRRLVTYNDNQTMYVLR
jgi:hypothetical protein